MTNSFPFVSMAAAPPLGLNKFPVFCHVCPIGSNEKHAVEVDVGKAPPQIISLELMMAPLAATIHLGYGGIWHTLLTSKFKTSELVLKYFDFPVINSKLFIKSSGYKVEDVVCNSDELVVVEVLVVLVNVASELDFVKLAVVLEVAVEDFLVVVVVADEDFLVVAVDILVVDGFFGVG